MLKQKKLLGDLVVGAGYATDEQIQSCLKIQKTTGERLGDVLISEGYITSDQLMRILEHQHNIEYIDLNNYTPEAAVVRRLAVDIARRNMAGPVKIEKNIFYVALEDPKNFRALDAVRNAVRMETRPILASGKSIETYLDRLYGNVSAQRALVDYDKELTGNAETTDTVSEEIATATANAPIVRFVNSLILQAVKLGASDIHLEPQPNDVRVRMRVDGVLISSMNVSSKALPAIIARIKILSRLDITEKRAPQDGRFSLDVNGKELSVRVSTMPNVFGEKIVMRLLDQDTFLIPKDKLGLNVNNLKQFDSLMRHPHGIVLLTGPTGSGKSTTMYTMLSELNTIGRNIVTIEDPVEYTLPGISQTQINPQAGIDFASGLRSILRQDPDIIMVGEIRDDDTVSIAIRAAITGHLVLSTLHTNDTVSSIFRLIDMGVPSYMVAVSVVGVIAQRLIRLVCPSCRERYHPSHEELQASGISMRQLQDMKFFRGSGCPSCNEQGYKGRVAVFEVLSMTPSLREMVHKGASIDEIRQHVNSSDTFTLRDSAIELLKAGQTTLEEVAAVSYGQI